MKASDPGNLGAALSGSLRRRRPAGSRLRYPRRLSPPRQNSMSRSPEICAVPRFGSAVSSGVGPTARAVGSNHRIHPAIPSGASIPWCKGAGTRPIRALPAERNRGLRNRRPPRRARRKKSAIADFRSHLFGPIYREAFRRRMSLKVKLSPCPRNRAPFSRRIDPTFSASLRG